ncbi:MAG: hypothetical protein N3A02_05955, partial [Rectinema sp.]|nr:hypothetical protein [Rectinema sp.]
VVYSGWHNYAKLFRIGKAGIRKTHAEMAGIPKEVLKAGRYNAFLERVFLSRIDLSPLERRLWLRGFPTPLKKREETMPAYVFD